MKHILQRLARRAGLLLAGLVAVGLLVLVGIPMVLRLSGDATFAQSYFSGIVPFDRVLASRKWHGFGAESWDCTYAVVALSGAAPELPESRDDEARGWRFHWGGDWQPTPAPPLGDTTRDALDFCARYFDKDINARLTAAISQPGSWYMRDGVGETVLVYSVPQGIAARIRFGD